MSLDDVQRTIAVLKASDCRLIAGVGRKGYFYLSHDWDNYPAADTTECYQVFNSRDWYAELDGWLCRVDQDKWEPQKVRRLE